MYDSFQSDGENLPLRPGRPDPALLHRGDYQRLLRRHHRDVARAFTEGGLEGLRALDEFLLPRIADARTMRVAADYLRIRGGRAPGPDGLCLHDLSDSEVWSCCRAMAEDVRMGVYAPGPDRVVRVAKEGRHGEYRELTLRNFEDRIVGRGLLLVLREIVEYSFSPFSFGFRPRRGPLQALATAMSLGQMERRWVWAGGDVERAFDRIPHARFLGACQLLFPDDLVEFIAILSRPPGGKRGLRQGSPESPMFCNIHFNHFLDQPWHRHHPEMPLLRYADDLLLLCGTREEAAKRYAELSQMATSSSGTPLKVNAGDGIVDLQAGEPMTWLGFLLQRDGKYLTVRIAQKAWDKLEWHVDKARLGPEPQVRAARTIEGWLTSMAPCFQFEDRPGVFRRLRDIVAAHALDASLDENDLTTRWSAAHARWHRLRVEQAKLLPDRLRRVRGGQASPAFALPPKSSS